LVLVLWMLTLLAVMAGSFALSMRRETAIMMGVKNTAQARAVAEAGIAIAELMLLDTDPSLRWLTDGHIYEINYAGARVRIRLLSEAGKIDINTADEARLQELMSHAGIDETTQLQIVNAILDWRDGDDLTRIDGAEKNEYQAAGLKYAPSNKSFQSLAELQMVLGMNSDVFNWLEPLITVYSNQQVNPQKASREVLQVLNLTDAASEPQIPEPPPIPDNPFAAAAQRALQPAGQTDANEAVTIIAEAMLDTDRTTVVKAVVKKSSKAGEAFEILDWQTDVSGRTSLFAADMDALLY